MSCLNRTFYLIAGHSQDSPGALSALGVFEHEYTKKLRDIISQKFMYSGISYYRDRDDLKLMQVIEWIRDTKDNAYFIDIHFNDNNPKATGTEIFIHEKSSDETKKIAENIVNNISKVLDIPVRVAYADRKYKFPNESNRSTLGMIDKVLFDVPKNPKPVFLIEVCFLNEKDLKKYIGKEDKVADAIINSFKI
jgi:hypothetical protein